MIGFFIRTDSSISYLIQSLYVAYIPEITIVIWEGLIFAVIKSRICEFVFGVPGGNKGFSLGAE